MSSNWQVSSGQPAPFGCCPAPCPRRTPCGGRCGSVAVERIFGRGGTSSGRRVKAGRKDLLAGIPRGGDVRKEGLPEAVDSRRTIDEQSTGVKVGREQHGAVCPLLVSEERGKGRVVMFGARVLRFPPQLISPDDDLERFSICHLSMLGKNAPSKPSASTTAVRQRL